MGQLLRIGKILNGTAAAGTEMAAQTGFRFWVLGYRFWVMSYRHDGRKQRLNIKFKKTDIAVFHDILFPFGTDQTLFP